MILKSHKSWKIIVVKSNVYDLNKSKQLVKILHNFELGHILDIRLKFLNSMGKLVKLFITMENVYIPIKQYINSYDKKKILSK